VSTEEQDYTDLAELAASLCQTSIAAISLLDQGQLYFKAMKGLTPQQLSRENPFSEQVIETGISVLIPDASLDSRFANHPWVLGPPHIRLYAGVPLRTKGGEVVGTLCVMDSIPKSITNAQIKGLQTLAQQVLNLLELRAKTRELEEKYTILQDNNHLLWGTVSRSSHDLDQLNSELETLLYRASHDIARPLSSLEGLSRLARMESLPDDQRRLWEGVAHTTKEMRNLTNKFQQISEALSEAPEISFPVSKIEELLIVAVSRVRDRFPEANFSWEVIDAESSPLSVSPQLMVIILTNLVENVWVFRKTNQKEPPWIRLEILPTDHAVTFSFHDQGIGMSPQVVDRAFEMFYRGSEASKGNGLGLYVVGRVVNALSGVYFITSEEKKGTTFTFSLAI